MKNVFLPLVAVVGACLLGVSCRHNEPIELKLHLQPGSQYTYSIQTNTSTEQKPMGQSIASTQEMLMEMTYKAGEPQDGLQPITVTYDRLRMNMKSPVGDIGFDSKDSTHSDPKLAMLGSMVGKQFVMQVSPDGDIQKVEGLDVIISSIGDTTTPEGLAIHRQMAETFNDTAVRSLMRQSLDIFPNKPVQPGDSWTKSYNMDMNVMQMKVENLYTLKSISGNTAHLELKAKINGDGTADMPEMKGVKISLNGEQTGTMDVDIATGLVSKGDVNWNINGSMSMMGMKMPISINSTVHMSAKKN
ncbi:MAG: hypothetical protein JST06_08885 [Bacteroidetes bacterium]|nr:hypothetical protein [Bacteroidota bacterium]MBS1630237.1 hypothetical protein [Bacteroidota bacterium]